MGSPLHYALTFSSVFFTIFRQAARWNLYRASSEQVHSDQLSKHRAPITVAAH